MALARRLAGQGWRPDVRAAVALTLVVAACAGFVAGQSPSVSAVSRMIEGMVVDRSGHPVPGAVVLLEDLKSLQVRSYIVQEDGKFHFRGLNSEANYELRARLNGVSSGAKTVSVFEKSSATVVNLTLPAKPKRAAPPAPPPLGIHRDPHSNYPEN